MKGNGRALLISLILLSVLLARMLYPAGAAYLRRETARVLAADLENFTLVETLGRVFAEERVKEEWIAALRRELSGARA